MSEEKIVETQQPKPEENIVQDIIEETPEEEKVQVNNNIPISRIIVGLVETPIQKLIPEEEKRKEFLYNYESQCLPILDAIKFDEVVQRKLFNGKELTDNQVIVIGLGTIGLTAVLNALPYIKFKKKDKKEVNINEKNNNKES